MTSQKQSELLTIYLLPVTIIQSVINKLNNHGEIFWSAFFTEGHESNISDTNYVFLYMNTSLEELF